MKEINFSLTCPEGCNFYYEKKEELWKHMELVHDEAS